MLPAAAHAHRAQVKANILRLSGSPWTGFLLIKPAGEGRIQLDLPDHPPSGSLVIDYRVNGLPRPGMSYPLSSDRQTWPLGFTTSDQDKVEINDVRVLDHSGNVVGVIGSENQARGRDVFSAPLVWVVDTMSDVGFTRGGDTVLSRKGAWSVGFDALRSRSTGDRLNNAGNYAEIEASINNGPWQVFSVAFDVASGKSRPRGRPGIPLPMSIGDRVKVRRVDCFDSGGRKFATLGIRMGKQGHYLEAVPTLAPSPTPTLVPTATPTPMATLSDAAPFSPWVTAELADAAEALELGGLKELPEEAVGGFVEAEGDDVVDRVADDFFGHDSCLAATHGAGDAYIV